MLLETKLHPPRRRRTLVARPRLTGLLARVREASLTLVSAPAGFGKSTLLGEWAHLAREEGDAVAWLSLDAREEDPATFVAHLLAACRAALPDVGAAAEAGRKSGAPADAVLASLLTDLATVPGDVVVVLDDVHVVEARAVHDALAFLLDNLPPRVHLVLGTRADPPVPLARLRARGELVEVRAADLRFTPVEAARYLTEAMGLQLAEGDVAALEGRTEGWIAALQLAALSLQGRDDAAAFVAAFSGDDRYVVDYLVEEVLHRQPPEVRDFLLRTSVLARLTGDLCDAVTGRDDGRATLERLERANLFLVPLDDRRRWYRYHHLFADVLQARLLDEEPTAVPGLHRRASAWFEEHGDRLEAIRHAFAGGDVARAADLVELALPDARRERRDATLRSWFEALPDDVVRSRPVLAVGDVGAHMVVGEVAGVERRLADAERWLTATDDERAGMVVVDAEAFAGLPGVVATYRAALALLAGDLEATQRHARRALDLARPEDHLARGAPGALLALALWASGDLDDARRRYVTAIDDLEAAGHRSDALGCTLALSDILLAQGRLAEAERAVEDALRRTASASSGRPGSPPQPGSPSGVALRGTADMHVALAEIYRERDRLDAAREHLRLAEALGDAAGLAQNPYRRLLAAARLRLVDGDATAALGLVEAAQRVFAGDFSPDARPLAAVRARVLLALGRVEEAAAWARERGLSPGDDLSYLREYEHVTLARVLLAEHRLDDAAALLARLAEAAERGGRLGTLAEIHALQARPTPAPVPASLTATATPVEPLSARERDVLRLLASELTGPEIARELYVSVNTLRTHTKSIYTKLAVTSRRAAVRRASELGLLDRRAAR